MSAEKRWSYLYDLVPESGLVTVIDIGANPINPAPYQALLDAQLCNVYGFEPNKDAFDKLKAQASPCEEYFNVAVGPKGKRTLNLYPASGFSSLFPLDETALNHLGKFQGQLGKETPVEIDLVPLDQVKNLPDADLLKIDVQGAELEIIKSGRKRLKNVCAMIVETRIYPIYTGEPTWQMLDAHLQKMGLAVHKFLSQASFAFGNSLDLPVRMPQMQSQLLDGDVVYIPDHKGFEAASDEKLLKQAVLADAVYNSFDVTLKCLETLHHRGKVSRDQILQYCQLLPGYLQRK